MSHACLHPRDSCVARACRHLELQLAHRGENGVLFDGVARVHHLHGTLAQELLHTLLELFLYFPVPRRRYASPAKTSGWSV